MTKTSKLSMDRQLEFMEAAQELFSEKGFENTSVDDIINRVGVAKGLFYYYFDSKEDLVQIMLWRLLEEIESAIAAAMEKKGLSAMERFNELVSTNRDVACRSAILILYFRQDRNKAIHLTMEKRARELMTGAMEEIICQGNDEGLFHVTYTRETSIALLSAYHGLGMTLEHPASEAQARRRSEVLQDISERLLGMSPSTFIVDQGFLPPPPYRSVTSQSTRCNDVQ
jgi:AcrR family transcriptional regulator